MGNDAVLGDKIINIAIDGPSGVGKSSIAKLLSKELNCIYVDTGAMYRATAYYFLENNLDLDDSSVIEKGLINVKIEIKFVNNEQRIFLNSTDVTEKIRNQTVADASSKVAVNEKVREKLVEMQREIAKNNNSVMDGRDIGTHVIPQACIKIYMEAEPMVRAERRVKELSDRGIKADILKVKEEIEIRDDRDKTRVHSPLRKADDAILIDTSHMTIEQVKNKILELYYRLY